MTALAAALDVEPKPLGPGRDQRDRAPSSTPGAPSWRATIAAERCYWAILAPEALGSPPPSPRLMRSLVASRSPALDEALQRWLPVPVDAVHAAYVLIARGTSPVILACAVPLDVAQRWRDAGILSAGPDALPALAPDITLPGAGAIEFMAGLFAPPALTRAARRTTFASLAGALVLTGLLAIGLSRRAAANDARADVHRAWLTRVHERALGVAAPDPRRADRAITAEIARLRAAALGPMENTAPSIDAAALAADLLARWPADAAGLFARLQSMQVTPAGITLSVLLAAEADPEPILAPLRTVTGWQLQPTQRTSAPPAASGQAETRLTLRLVPTSPTASTPTPTPTPAPPAPPP